MPSNITAPRVPLTDPRTGLVSREWYNFFLTLFNLTGAGQNLASITDLQVGPPSVDVGDVALLADMTQGLKMGPPAPDAMVLAKAVQGLQTAPSAAGLTERVAELAKAVQGLQVDAPVVPSTTGIVMTVVATLDFPNTLAQTSSDLTVTVPGAVDGDVVTLGVPNACTLLDSCYTGWVSAADTVTVRFSNYSAGAQNPANGSFRVVVTRL